MTELIAWGGAGFIITFFTTVLVRRIAHKFSIVDRPTEKKNVHKRPTALLGGIAIYLAVAAIVTGLLLTSNQLTAGSIQATHYLSIIIGGLIIVIGGILDDKYNLPPKFAIIAPLIAATLALVFGIEIEKLTNPLGGVIYLESWQSDLIVFTWLMIVMYTTKFLDGLDGLATSVSAVGSLMILLLAMTTAYFQPDVALLASISFGAYLGFLFWNIHPASIFLGEGGSVFVGYLLGILAVISGGKLATALLVLGIPLLDIVWTILRRLRAGGIKRLFQGDRKHLHHRLIDRGWGQKKIMTLYILIATAFGITTLFFQSKEKLVALIVLTFMMLLAAFYLSRADRV